MKIRSPRRGILSEALSGGVLEGSWSALGGVSESLGGLLEVSWRSFGGLLDALGCLVDALGGVLGALGGLLGALGRSWRPLGGVRRLLEASWMLSEAFSHAPVLNLFSQSQPSLQLSSLFCYLT